MTPDQFLSQLAKRPPEPAYLFLGPEPYRRDACRRALLARALPAEQRQDGLTRHDLEEVSLGEALDDARSLSLFASDRVLYLTGAEAALPKGRSEASDDGGADALAAYLRNPTPGTVLVFEASRYDFDGEDKAKLERVQKFYGAIPATVEFRRFSVPDARELAAKLAREANLRLGPAEVELLVEALGADASRLAVEIEKLSLYAGPGGTLTADDLAALVPNARSSTIFGLVAAVGAGQAERSLDILDQLVREGEYLPLALSFLGTQFRLALLAREANLQGAQQIQSHCQRLGIPMWRARAEQVAQTTGAFSKGQLRAALRLVYETDKGLRMARPDDRLVMERFVLGMTRGERTREGTARA